MKLFICLLIIGTVNANGTPSPPSFSLITKSLTTANGDTTQLPSMTSAGTESMSTTSPLSTTTVQSDTSKILIKDKPVVQDTSILGIVGTKGTENLDENAKVDAPKTELNGIKDTNDKVYSGVSKTDGIVSDDIGVKGKSIVNHNSRDINLNVDVNSVNSQQSFTEEKPKELKVTNELANVENLTSTKTRSDVILSLESITLDGKTTDGKNSSKTLTETQPLNSDPLKKENTGTNRVLVPGEIKAGGALNENLGDLNSNKRSKLSNCNVKNSTCVPTREELVGASEPNPDMMQHKVNVLPTLLLKEVSNTNKTTTGPNLTNPGCNVKNSTCVSTREELVAAGESNPDMMQHKVNVLPKLLVKAMPSTPNPPVNSNANKPGCNVKSSKCVSTEKELLASGVDRSGLGQYSIDTENVFLGQSKQSVSNVIKDAVAKTPKSDYINSSQDTVDKTITGTDNTNSKQNEVALVKGSVIETTEAMKPTTVLQIPGPSKTTQQTKLSTPTTDSSVLQTSTEASANIMTPKKNESKIVKETTQGLTTSAVTRAMASADVQPTSQTPEFYTCPVIKCKNTCGYGRKVNSDGCETCECKFDNGCPRVSSVSRLLCLLRASTSQSCQSNDDCRRNRICCPGTCGPICRRPSRTRSMLLSMLVD